MPPPGGLSTPSSPSRALSRSASPTKAVPSGRGAADTVAGRRERALWGFQFRVGASRQKAASSRAQAIATTPAGLRRWPVVPALVQAALGAPGDLDRARVLAALATRDRGPDRRPVAVVVGSLDQEPAGVHRSGLDDRALAALGVGGAHRSGRSPETQRAAWVESVQSRGPRRTARRPSTCRSRENSAAARSSRHSGRRGSPARASRSTPRAEQRASPPRTGNPRTSPASKGHQSAGRAANPCAASSTLTPAPSSGSPAAHNRARRSASRLSVLTRSPDAAAPSPPPPPAHRSPRSTAARARPKPRRSSVATSPQRGLLACKPSQLIQPPASPSPLTAAFQHRRNDDAELEQHEHRDQLEERGHEVGAWQEQRESDNCDDRVAPVFA